MRTTVPCCFCHAERDPYKMAVFYAEDVTICAECVELFHDSLTLLRERGTDGVASAGWPCGLLGTGAEGDWGMKHRDINDALWALSKQFQAGVTTNSMCSICHQQPARGVGPCPRCMEQELVSEWNVPRELVEKLMAAHVAARDAVAHLEDVREMAVKAAGG